MKTGPFKSTTALAVMLSLAAPVPAISQGKRAPIDISAMTEAEISDLVDKCKKRADRRERKLDAGEEVAQKRGPIAQFCETYGNGAFDELLPENLQSAAVLGADADATAEILEEEGAASDAQVEAENSTDTGAEATASNDDTTSATQQTDAQTQVGENTTSEANAASAETETETETETEVEAETETESTETTETTGASEQSIEDAETADAGEAQATDASQNEGEMKVEQSETDAQELQPVDSQAQADAVAAASEAAAAAAATSSEADTTAEAEVIEETVTEENSRSSDEEFETSVNESAAPSASAAAPAEDDEGLSDIQRAALLGLGALAVGKLLNSGEKVVSNSGDRAVVEQNGQYRVLKNDDALLRQPGSEVTTYRYKDGSTRTVVERENGAKVETIRAADGRVLRRTRILPDGRTVVLFDDTQRVEEVVVEDLPQRDTTEKKVINYRSVDAEDLAAALAAEEAATAQRRFSLSQVRGIDAVRRLVPEINVDSINFETGSAVIRPEEARELAALGNALRDMIDRNPREVFLIEGHTDAVGAASYNLALSDRRAETVALALSEYFEVPPENLVVQGYGETDLAVQTAAAERANRRVAVRRITPLLHGEQ
ncbi:OmpA family protein [Leisingera sp. XS_AS12]|uniref:OmpA family protein n=1 Tax=Leisingera sp. XS_AS12 TaxID=3241294 RepID=UPI0035140552